MASISVAKLYRSVIDEVVDNLREAFLNDDVDEQVLAEFKQLWVTKLDQSKVLQPPSRPPPLGATPVLHPTTSTATTVIGPNTSAAAPKPAQHAVPAPISGGPAPMVPAVLTNNMQPFTLQRTSQGQLIAVPTGAIPANAMPASAISAGTLHVAQPNPGAPQVAAMQSLATQQHRVLAAAQQQQQQQQQQAGQEGVLKVHQLDGAGDEERESGATELGAGAVGGSTSGSLAGKVARGNKVKVSVTKGGAMKLVVQLDGANDSSSDEDEDDEDDDEDDDNDLGEPGEEVDEAEGVEEDPLNSEDDISDGPDGAAADPEVDTDNVMVCLFDKINRCKNKWRFNFKDGIMNVNGRDHVFHKANGDSEW